MRTYLALKVLFVAHWFSGVHPRLEVGIQIFVWIELGRIAGQEDKLESILLQHHAAGLPRKAGEVRLLRAEVRVLTIQEAVRTGKWGRMRPESGLIDPEYRGLTILVDAFSHA